MVRLLAPENITATILEAGLGTLFRSSFNTTH
jgi:hypothetical protein